MKWSPQQSSALTLVSQWMRDRSNQVFYLSGFAGTGKTTLAKYLADPQRWRYAAFTGKAAHVLRQRGCRDASTIHSLIYTPAGESKAKELSIIEARIKVLEGIIMSLEDGEEKDGRKKELQRAQAQVMRLNEENRPYFDVWPASPLADPLCDGVVIDECSMVDERVGADLLSFGKKILVLGDPAQLPPVRGGGFFTNREPNVTLTEVHRQARESGVLRLATKIREGGLPVKEDSCDDVLVIPVDGRRQDRLEREAMSATQILVGRNRTRAAINKRVRELLGRKSREPVVGDRVVCLRNDRELGMYNGSQWAVDQVSLDGDTCDLELTSEDDAQFKTIAPCWTHHFLGRGEELTRMGHRRRDQMEVDYTYALTCHKSQGSQWESVCVFDEGASFGEHATRWRYTAVTRASKRVVVVL